MVVGAQPSDSASDWDGLAPWEQAAEWHVSSPELAEKIMGRADQHLTHKQTMEKLRFWFLEVGGLLAVILIAGSMAVVTWHAADQGLALPTAGAAAGAGLSAHAAGLLTRKARAGKKA